MDFRQLKYFLVVSEELSFSRAAERCFISQSAISHQVARLEKELGATLFERSTEPFALPRQDRDSCPSRSKSSASKRWPTPSHATHEPGSGSPET